MDNGPTMPVNAVGNFLTGGQDFAQKLDELYIYHQRVLTPAEVQSLYLASLGNLDTNLISDTSPVTIAAYAALNLNDHKEACREQPK
jgi:hypothetical protein